jgi:hypothetical protein
MFPERLEVFKDIPLDQPLTPEQSIIEAEAWNLQKQVCSLTLITFIRQSKTYMP